MATPNKPQNEKSEAAPTPPVAEGALADDKLRRELYAAQDKLERLKAEKQLEIVNAEIAKLENGGKSAAQVDREKKAAAVRAQTFTEELEVLEKGDDGKSKPVVRRFAKYRIPEACYKPDMPGGLPRYRPPGFIATVHYETLPSEGWQAVQPTPKAPALEFQPKG